MGYLSTTDTNDELVSLTGSHTVAASVDRLGSPL